MYLTVKKLSDRLSIHRSTIYRWMSNYQIPYYKIRGRILFKESEIENWISNFHVTSIADDIKVSSMRA